MPYPKISDAQVTNADKYGDHNAIPVGSILQNFSVNKVTDLLTGGSTGTTVTKQFFIAPEKILVTNVNVLIDVAVTGSGNVPVLTLQYGNVVLGTVTVTSANTAGTAVAGVLNATAANLVVPAGGVLKVVITTPSATITTPVQCKLQTEFQSIA